MDDRRVNYIAVVVAAVAYFVLGAIWFSAFRGPWLEAVGKTPNQLTGSPATGYVVAFVSNLVIAWILARLIIAMTQRGLVRGAAMGALLWLGFTATTMATEFVFEGRTLGAYGIIAGYPLVGMLVMGAILGRWHKGSA
ncbi:MAG TPA: DUF1761 domain-containing protein [Terriglobia bacterium]|nr:DUF1761 domain-containing protein [Terriglobia bacterium]